MSAADAEEMSGPLKARGYRQTAELADADAVLINTCTVRQHAEDRALSLIGTLRPWKEENPQRLLIVAGCAAERLSGWLRKRFPYIDLVVGAKSIDSFPAILAQALEERFDAPKENALAFSETAPEASPVVSFVTIMRGCNYSCAYCIVPAVRGRELYRPASDILDEIRRKVDGGAKEVLLLGQTVNSYDHSHEGRTVRFPDLLRLVDAVPGLERVRFMSPHPYYLDPKMIEAMAQCRTVCESLHMPVQSGSDRILKLMRRNYTGDSYLRRLEELRSAVPGIVLSTDIIVGFPTETEEEFQASLSLLESMRPASAYCFKYSPRESTEAASMVDDVAQEVKEDRLRRLNFVVDRLIEEALSAQTGKTLEVLTEQESFGRTRTAFKVKLDSPVPPGRLVRARITGSTRLTLKGELIT